MDIYHHVRSCEVQRRLRRTLLCVGICGFLALAGGTVRAETFVTSTLWTDFLAQKASAQIPATLPDFSYAGFDYSETAIPDVVHRIFNVNDFGAVANDDKSDRDALLAAVNAAQSHGSGIVFFGPGRFHLNEREGRSESIVIPRGRIVLRGSGAGANGTELVMRHPLLPKNPKQKYSTPALLHFATKGESEHLTEVTGGVRRGSFSVTVSDTSNLTVGMYVTLALRGEPGVTAALLHPYAAESAWVKTIKGINAREHHEIVELRDNSVVFREPVQVAIDQPFNWSLRTTPVNEGWGLEDVAFVGNWKETFEHHKSALHDSGFRAVTMSNARNSWIRRCRFVDWNIVIEVKDSAASSVLEIEIAGNRGHNAITLNRSYGILVGFLDDSAGQWHGPGVTRGNVGGVIWRSRWSVDSSIELHANAPYATLFDASIGGFHYGRFGGNRKGLPNHLRHLVLWNFKQLGAPIENYSFWRDDSKWGRVVMPIVVGYHGAGTTFLEDQLQQLESLGRPVAPESLFEAQLAHRLGGLPNWVELLKERNL